jgi:hypothetical protein
MWIERNAENALRKFQRQFPVILVTGARQTGKTSLLRYLYPDINYISLDDPALSQRADNSPGEFIESLETPVIIDEAQYSPGIFRFLKIAADKKKKNGAYFVTGSQHFSLMQNVSESMAGRCGIIYLQTLSIDEILQNKKIDISEYICKGGYPAIYSEKYAEARTWYPSYVATYLERDVRNILKVGNLRDFNRLLRGLAARAGRILSFSDIARDIGVAPNTVKSWISVLQASHLIYLLEPYHRNLGKRLVKSPKLYFCDCGLLVHLLGLNTWGEVEKSPVAGAVWENYVFNQLYRHINKSGAGQHVLWFWQNQSGFEIDFLIEKGGQFIAFESKLKEFPDANDTRNFIKLEEFYGKGTLLKGSIVCKTSKEYPINKNISVINGIGINF